MVERLLKGGRCGGVSLSMLVLRSLARLVQCNSSFNLDFTREMEVVNYV